MPSQIFAAEWVLPVDAPAIRDGAVVVDGTRLAWVGRRVDLPEAYLGGRVRAFPRGLLLPGLVNAHCHLPLTAMLGRLSGRADRFTDWIRAVLAEQARWTPDVPRLATRAGLDLLALRGVTTVGEVSAAPELPVFLEHPLRAVLYLELIAFPAARAADAEARARAWLDALQGRPAGAARLTAGLAPHAPYSASPELMRRVAALARERGVPVSIHLAEIREELRFLQRGGGEFEALLRERGAWDKGWRPPGVSPVRLAADAGLLAVRGAAVHLNYLSDDDVALLREGQLVPVWCPGSHAWFGHAEHPAERLLEAGVPVALGTDSLASNTALDMLAEMRRAAAAFPSVPPEVWLQAATLTAARALGLDDETGSLTPGKAADLIGLDAPGAVFDEPHRALLQSTLRLRLAMVDGHELAMREKSAAGETE